jgi:hypothetical protein
VARRGRRWFATLGLMLAQVASGCGSNSPAPAPASGGSSGSKLPGLFDECTPGQACESGLDCRWFCALPAPLPERRRLRLHDQGIYGRRASRLRNVDSRGQSLHRAVRQALRRLCVHRSNASSRIIRVAAFPTATLAFARRWNARSCHPHRTWEPSATKTPTAAPMACVCTTTRSSLSRAFAHATAAPKIRATRASPASTCLATRTSPKPAALCV